ncbi:MAG: hypothetical protein DMD93_09470 [Candidatus Rokuibacteriota bacterium]|nr:MAG: hypothetical protein DMD93_09470 [Candidatus Rokubacteria bacterium]
MKLFHRTTAKNAKAILAKGFTDATGSFGTTDRYTGVLLTSQPVDIDTIDITLIEVELDLDEDALAAYERPEKGKSYREWLVPAVLVNAHMNLRIIAGGKVDSE